MSSLRSHLSEARLQVGRIWVSGPNQVIEFALTGTRMPGLIAGVAAPPRTVGVVGAVVVRVDDRGRIAVARIYADSLTYLGQVLPTALPEGISVRPPAPLPEQGTGVREARGTDVEGKNLATTGASWRSLGAHRAAEVLAGASDHYVYEDFAAPKALDKTGTAEMVKNFLTLLPDFAIASTPTLFAAGDEVVTELDERATYQGKPVALHGLDIKRFRAGRIVHEWQYSDYAAVLRQLTDLAVPPTMEP